MKVFRTLNELKQAYWDEENYKEIYREMADVISHFKLLDEDNDVNYDEKQFMPIFGGNVMVAEVDNDINIIIDFLVDNSIPRSLTVAHKINLYYALFDGDSGDIYFVPTVMAKSSQFLRDCIGMSLDTGLAQSFWEE